MINRKYLPSKNFLFALSAAVVVILVAIILNYVKPNITNYTNSHLTANTNGTPVVANIDLDTDSDGLVDWKEGLYGTNSKLADTDGDGTSDFDEISQNRDPLKANTAPAGKEPNDKIDPAIIEENRKALEEYEKLNETDKFSRDLISNIIASQPINGPMDQDTANSVISKAESEIPVKNYSPITKVTDLNLLKTDSTNLYKNMTDYSKSFYIETQKLEPILAADLEVIDLYVSGSSTQVKPAMAQVTSVYQDVINNLIKMPVPVAIGYYNVNYHLKIINDLEIMIAIDNDIVNSDKDSFGIFSNLSKFNDVTRDLFSTLNTVDGILKIQR